MQNADNGQAQTLINRQRGMEGKRGNWETLWEQVSLLVLPRADDFITKHSPGVQRNQNQYDAFPMAALDKFAAAIESGLMPRNTLWHNMVTGDEELDNDHEVKLFLEAYNTILWEERYSPRGNYSSQAHEKLIFLGAYGTGCMLVEPRDGGGIRYKSIHLAEIFIQEDREGTVDTVHRKFEMTARKAAQTFKEDTPQKILDKINDNKMDERFEFLHCVMPREDFDSTRMDQAGMPFAGYYIFMPDQSIIREEGYHEQPYIVSRYAVSTREVYGRSPAIQLLPDISMLNEMRRTTIEAANMAVDPPVLQADDGISEFDLTPGSRNLGALDDQGRPMAVPWNTGVDVRLGLDMMQDTRSQIDDGFLGIYFRVLLENPSMTATQAMLLAQQQGQLTAPIVGRLQSEWLGRQMRRESGILFRQGKHPPMPEVLQEHLRRTGKPIKIEYQSPMTRAARSEEAVGILRTFESLAPIAQIDPTVFEVFDTQEIARIVSDVNGVPAKALKSKAKLEEEAAGKQQQQQLGEVLEAAPIAAQTAKTLADAQAAAQSSPQSLGVA